MNDNFILNCKWAVALNSGFFRVAACHVWHGHHWPKAAVVLNINFFPGASYHVWLGNHHDWSLVSSVMYFIFSIKLIWSCGLSSSCLNKWHLYFDSGMVSDGILARAILNEFPWSFFPYWYFGATYILPYVVNFFVLSFLLHSSIGTHILTTCTFIIMPFLSCATFTCRSSSCVN